MKIDALDKKILASLLQNARAPTTQIAKHVGASNEVVTYRIKRLEEQHIIAAYVTRINQSIFYDAVAALNITLSTKPSLREQAIQTITKNANTNWVAEMCGESDLRCTLPYKNTTDLHKMIKEIQDIVGVLVIKQATYLDEYKFSRKGLITQKGEEAHEKERIQFIGKQQVLNKTDVAILKQLVSNARISATEIKTNITPDGVRKRIKQLEETGIIQGYTIHIRPEVLGFDGYHIELTLQPFTSTIEAKLRQWAHQQPAIIYCTHTTGDHNVVITAHTASRKEFDTLLQDLRRTFSEQLKRYVIQLHMGVHKELFLPERTFTASTNQQ